jgi:uncharacterized cupin superfamily protein
VATPTSILRADARRDDLVGEPIPASDVIDGAPVARSVRITESADRLVSTHLLDCTAGRFHWRFGVDEIVHILEGEVQIEDDHGATFSLGAGDVAHFPLGAHTVWHVPVYVRKLAVHRAPSLATRVTRRLRRLARLTPTVGPWLAGAGAWPA